MRVFTLALCLLMAGCGGPAPDKPTPIPGQAVHGSIIGAPAVPRLVLSTPIPQHPFMAANGQAAMHADGFSSDTHPAAGPLGHAPRITSRLGSPLMGGTCATLSFDRAGRIVALCADISGFRLQLLEPQTLEKLANFELPTRPSTFQALVHADIDRIMSDTSGGAYYYLDNQDRAVLADAEQQIRRIAHRERSPGQWEFVESDRWDMRPHVPHDCQAIDNWFPRGECDPITAVMPDHQGLIWWVTRHARIGTLNPATGAVKAIQLKGEEIQNGFSVATDGVSIVSDHALYHFTASPDGTPQQLWRERYDRGTGRKIGSINQGSGTTPTLMGERYVAITDNADERMNVLVYRRDPGFQGQRLICQVPVFTRGASTTDNSLIGWNRSIIVENNHGYRNALVQRDWQAVAGGISRIDIREDESGCDVVWTSPERAPSVVPKLSLGNGLAYFYTFQQQSDGQLDWYLMALDSETGETVFKINTGRGSKFDNNWSPITIGPDGTAYIGTLRGLVAVKDGR